MSDDAEDEESEEDAYTLSFIDVVSCGLAAALLLFLVYTVLPHMGRSGTIHATVTSTYAPPGTERIAAGVAKDERTAKLAITVMSVSVEISAKDGAGIRWEGLPKGCHSHVLTARTQLMFISSCAAGIPADKEVTLAIARGPDARTLKVESVMFVGGSAPILPNCELSENASDELVRFTPSHPTCQVKKHGK